MQELYFGEVRRQARSGRRAAFEIFRDLHVARHLTVGLIHGKRAALTHLVISMLPVPEDTETVPESESWNRKPPTLTGLDLFGSIRIATEAGNVPDLPCCSRFDVAIFTVTGARSGCRLSS